jgi:uncharacterized membrane protein YcaP (DUF421 family)
MSWLSDALAGLGSTALAYLIVLAGVRLAGRRTVSQMSAFDVVITIALGSLLAQTSTSGTGLVRGLVGVAALLILQTSIGWVRRRFPLTQRWIDFTPRIVLEDGEVRRRALAGAIDGPQITEEELRGMLRARGVRSMDDLSVAVLERTGELSVLQRDQAGPTRSGSVWGEIGEIRRGTDGGGRPE